METNIEWYDAREVLPLENELVLISGVIAGPVTCITVSENSTWRRITKYLWIEQGLGACYPVSRYQLWCHWPTVNDEGCVG